MEWRLNFSGLQSGWWTASVVLGVAVAIGLFLMLRRYEARLVSGNVSRLLLALRCSVLLLLLLTFLQPVLVKAWSRDQQPTIVVGFDASESMDTADRHASPAEMLRWAQALGMLGNDQTDSLLEQWVQDYDSGRVPDFDAAGPNGDVRRDQVQDVFQEFQSMPRTEFVRRLLMAQPNNLLKTLQDQVAVDLQVFGMEQLEVSQDGLSEFLQSRRDEIRPSGTSLSGLLSESLSRQDSDRLRGIVLLTDGRQTTSGDPAAEAERLASLQIPVYPVPIGSRLAPRDLSIATIDAPRSVFVEDAALVQATVRTDGYQGDDIEVLLKQNDLIVDRRTVLASGADVGVEFEIPTDTVGSTEYQIETAVLPGELRDDNNSRNFTVSVVDNKAAVLLVEGDARWEFRYLKNALERDKQVKLETVLFEQPYLQLLNRPFLDSTLLPDQEFRDQLRRTDILIVGDVAPEKFGDSRWRAVEQAVSDDGLTVVMIPGKEHLPGRHPSDALSRLLPVSDFRKESAERYQRSLPDSEPSVFRLQPTDAVRRMAVFDFGEPADGQRPVLQQLPGHFWAYSGSPKPVATVWAWLDIPGPDLTEPLASVVHHYYGFGQVVWMGIDSTWRWRFRAGDTWHHRFWGQIVRWAARNKASAGNDQVRLTVSSSVIEESESVDVAARFEPKLVANLKGADVKVRLERIDDQEQIADVPNTAVDDSTIVSLFALPDAPARYSGQISGLKPGQWKMSLLVEESDVVLKNVIETELIVKPKLSTELANVTCQRDFLDQLATMTGGRVLEPWQLDQLPDLLQPDQSQTSERQELTAWDHWGLMLLFFALLTTEWVIRKLNGLP